jgi:hypothetical protein
MDAAAPCRRDNFADKSAAPHQVAMAVDISPTSSNWEALDRLSRSATGSTRPLGVGGGESGVTADEARRFAQALIDVSNLAERLDAEVIPHLKAAVAAAAELEGQPG